MKKFIILIGILLLCCLQLSAQKKIVLKTPKMQYVETHLYDEEGNFLLTLPLTFSLSNNILSMMTGHDTELGNNQAVWLFSEPVSLDNLMKKDSNVGATKSFKKNQSEFSVVLLPNRKISLYRAFDDGYEVIKKNAKPVFFEISSVTQPIIFYLQFYISKPDNKISYVFFAKCKPIEIELNVK